jgi:hypothetical protein
MVLEGLEKEFQINFLKVTDDFLLTFSAFRFNK